MRTNRTNKTNINEKKIFNRRLALALREKGFNIIKTEPNFYKPEFDVYIFENSDKLDMALTELTQK